MKAIAVTRELKAPVEVVWELIGRGDGLELWFPPVTSCRLEGSGEGARRVCEFDGSVLEETLVTVDPDARLFQYRIDRQSQLPLTDLLGTIHVTEAASGRSRVLWALNFELDAGVDAAALPEIRSTIAAIYEAGLEGLERYAHGEMGTSSVPMAAR